MNLLAEIIEQIRSAAKQAECDGVVINAEISLIICERPVVVRVPIVVEQPKTTKLSDLCRGQALSGKKRMNKPKTLSAKRGTGSLERPGSATRDYYHLNPTKCVCTAVRNRGETECGADTGAVTCTKPKGHLGKHTACGLWDHRIESWPNDQAQRLPRKRSSSAKEI